MYIAKPPGEVEGARGHGAGRQLQLEEALARDAGPEKPLFVQMISCQRGEILVFFFFEIQGFL